MSLPVLTVPGWTSSGPEHWQSHWERANPDWRRVEQHDWDRPEPAAWLSALDAAVCDTRSRTGRAPILVGHSLGALLIVMWAVTYGAQSSVAAALLVAPSDVERPDRPNELATFAPIRRERLPFPAVLAASRNDPYLAFDRAVALAADWGAKLHDCGMAGHLNAASGHGPWAEGERLLADLIGHASPRTVR